MLVYASVVRFRKPFSFSILHIFFFFYFINLYVFSLLFLSILITNNYKAIGNRNKYFEKIKFRTVLLRGNNIILYFYINYINIIINIILWDHDDICY